MKTEEWEESFREKVNGLDSPPPQTQWAPARSWGKLERQLATQSERDKKRVAWWVYAVAAVLLLIPALMAVYYFNRQSAEIHQLQAELTKAKTRHNFRPDTAVVNTGVAETAGKTVIPQHQTLSVKQLAVNQVKRGEQAPHKKTSRLVSVYQQAKMSVADQTSAGELTKNTSVPMDTTRKGSDGAPVSVSVARIIRKAARAPVSRTVVFVFQGEEKSQEQDRLADASLKPAKKFIFLSGEKEASSSTKPPDPQNSFLFTAKFKANP